MTSGRAEERGGERKESREASGWLRVTSGLRGNGPETHQFRRGARPGAQGASWLRGRRKRDREGSGQLLIERRGRKKRR